MPITSGTPIPFLLSHSPLFVNLMSIISGTAIPFKLSHSLLFINLGHIISDTSNIVNYIRNRSDPEVCMLVFQTKGHSFNFKFQVFMDQSSSLSDDSINSGLVGLLPNC